jgi:hypothetical protein
MATALQHPDRLNKVVVACIDGRRLKGHAYNFSAAADHFQLFSEDESSRHAGVLVKFTDLKAIFFVKDFAGNSRYQDRHDLPPHGHGRGIEVTFKDGETIAGTTESYNPQRIGFFLFPADQGGNNIRIFVVNKSVRQVKVLQSTPAR